MRENYANEKSSYLVINEIMKDTEKHLLQCTRNN